MSIPFIYLIIVILFALSWFFGRYMYWAMDPTEKCGEFRRGLEKFLDRAGGRYLKEDQDWKHYSFSLMIFNAITFGVSFILLALQQYLPLNPDGKGAVEYSLIFNTVASFTTNTNLQHYSGEVSMSYFSQLFTMMWHQFISAGTGVAALAALARGLAGSQKLGNFYRDFARATFLVFLPLATVVATILALSGMVMTLEGSVVAKTLEGAAQTIARGPVAAMVTIKQFGTNGGGFYGANSTHPFENPTFFTNIITCMGIMLVPMASVWMFGHIIRRMKHAAIIFSVMAIVLVTTVALALFFEKQPGYALSKLPVIQNWGNLEGKELRFGENAGSFWAILTTSTSNGSVNCMHDSLNPLTGLLTLLGLWLNCIFGGVGVGMINMFLYIVIGVFISGMMVGRTPEYLTRKVETREMKIATLAVLLHPLLILGGTAIFATSVWGTGTVHNPGSHGFSEILYEFSSSAANNGSGFEGLGDNTIPWNLATGIVMLLARFIPIILPLCIAGTLARKKPTPETSGTFRVDSLLFGIVLLGTIILIAALLFMPVGVLGPIAEHLLTIK